MTEYDIKKIAGRHLGRTSSGESMTPYEAPEAHDPTLLVPIPRNVGREKSGITAPMVGFDIWHAYEFSFLAEGVPHTGTLKFRFSAKTANMIESKSFKLYLNSFDFESFSDDFSAGEHIVVNTISNELSKVAGENITVHVEYHDAAALEQLSFGSPFLSYHTFKTIDYDYISNIVFDESVETLKTRYATPEGSHSIFTFHTSNLRSACEITNQKDTGHCFIAMRGEATWKREELARFIFSMRNAQHFHENVTEIIYDKLYNFYEPKDLFVANIYNRRGGLDIHPIRGTSTEFIEDMFPKYSDVGKYIRLTNQV